MFAAGGSLITMLADYFGENFFVGLRAYLHKFAYDNAVSNDLIRAVTEAANDPNVDVNVSYSRKVPPERLAGMVKNSIRNSFYLV